MEPRRKSGHCITVSSLWWCSDI